MKEYRLLPDNWIEEDSVYFHVETPEQESEMWNYVRYLEEEYHCNVEVIMNGEKIL